LNSRIAHLETKLLDARSEDAAIAVEALELKLVQQGTELSKRKVENAEKTRELKVLRQRVGRNEAASKPTPVYERDELLAQVSELNGQLEAERHENEGLQGKLADAKSLNELLQTEVDSVWRRLDEARARSKVHRQSRVIEIGSHTAKEQMEHSLKHMLLDTQLVMECAGLVPQNITQRVSVAFFSRVMGDHVNDSLWALVETEKFQVLEQLIQDLGLTQEVSSKLRIFSRTYCSKHKLAKISKDACHAMGNIQSKTAMKALNLDGHTVLIGRTYEARGSLPIKYVNELS
jgi:regulator of replication initiation timing